MESLYSDKCETSKLTKCNSEINIPNYKPITFEEEKQENNKFYENLQSLSSNQFDIYNSRLFHTKNKSDNNLKLILVDNIPKEVKFKSKELLKNIKVTKNRSNNNNYSLKQKSSKNIKNLSFLEYEYVENMKNKINEAKDNFINQEIKCSLNNQVFLIKKNKTIFSSFNKNNYEIKRPRTPNINIDNKLNQNFHKSNNKYLNRNLEKPSYLILGNKELYPQKEFQPVKYKPNKIKNNYVNPNFTKTLLNNSLSKINFVSLSSGIKPKFKGKKSVIEYNSIVSKLEKHKKNSSIFITSKGNMIDKKNLIGIVEKNSTEVDFNKWFKL